MPDRTFPRQVDRNVYPPPEYRFPDARIGLTYESSTPDFPPPQRAPEGAPNILLVLLDDVGYGWAEHLRRPHRVAHGRAPRAAGAALLPVPHHRPVLAHPGRAAHRAQPPQRGDRRHPGDGDRVPRLQRASSPASAPPSPSCSARTATPPAGGARTTTSPTTRRAPPALRPLAHPHGLRLLLRLHRRRDRPVLAGAVPGHHARRPAVHDPTRATSSPRTSPTTASAGCASRRRSPPTGRSSPTSPPGPPTHPTSRRSTGGAATPASSTWAGTSTARQVHERQLDLGVIPPGTQLTERPEEIPAWDDHTRRGEAPLRPLRRELRRLPRAHRPRGRPAGRRARRAGPARRTPWCIYIIGDNGSSAEGTLTGTINELAALGGVRPTIDMVMARIDEIGLPGTSPHYPVGWAWAGDTPFQWTKQIASHFGGTRNGMVVSWPKAIADGLGGTRFQFHHVIDVAPTLLEVAGIGEPSQVNGVPQRPIEGVELRLHLRPRGGGRRGGAQHAADAVLRDVRQPRPLRRRVDRLLPAQGLAALGHGRVVDGLHRRRMGALRHRQRLQPGRRPGRRPPAEAARPAGPVHGRGRPVQRAAARRRAWPSAST